MTDLLIEVTLEDTKNLLQSHQRNEELQHLNRQALHTTEKNQVARTERKVCQNVAEAVLQALAHLTIADDEIIRLRLKFLFIKNVLIKILKHTVSKMKISRRRFNNEN